MTDGSHLKRRFPGPQRVNLQAGALIRRAVRRQLMATGLDWTEDRGLLDSWFVIDVPDGHVFTWTKGTR